MARFIDDIIKAIEEHPHISATHKQLLISRIEKPPTKEEIDKAAKELRS